MPDDDITIRREDEIDRLVHLYWESHVFAQVCERPPQLPRPLTRYVDLQISRYLQRRAPRGFDDLPHLVEIGRLVSKGTSAWKAAGTVAERIGGDARVRHQNRRRVYEHYRKDAAIYLRIAQATDAKACIDEIIAEAVQYSSAEMASYVARKKRLMEVVRSALPWRDSVNQRRQLKGWQVH